MELKNAKEHVSFCTGSFCIKNFFFSWGSEELERGGISKRQTLQTLCVCVCVCVCVCIFMIYFVQKNEPGQWIIYEPASSHHGKTRSNI